MTTIAIPGINEPFTLPIMTRFFGGPGYDQEKIDAYREAVKVVVNETAWKVNAKYNCDRYFDAPPSSFRLIKFEVEDKGPMVNRAEMIHWMRKHGLELVHANCSELLAFGATFPEFNGPQIHCLGSNRYDDAGWWYSDGYEFPVLSFRDGSPRVAYKQPPAYQGRTRGGGYIYGWLNCDLFLMAELDRASETTI